MIAAKFFDDCFYKNDFYARIGGLSTEELNLLEVEFLCAINFSLLVQLEDYRTYHNEIYRHVSNGICPHCCSLSFPSMEWSSNSHVALHYESVKQPTPDSPCNMNSPCDVDL